MIWLPRIMPRWLFNISMDGDSTTSLGKQCQCSVNLIVKKCFLMFRGNFLCFYLCLLPLWSYDWASLKRTWLCFYIPFRCIDKIFPEPSLLQVEQSHLSHSFLTGERWRQITNEKYLKKKKRSYFLSDLNRFLKLEKVLTETYK